MTAHIERIRAAHAALKTDLRQTWVKLDKLPYIHATDNPKAKPYSTPVVGRFDYTESADYIMACNPAAMSEVLAHIDKLEAENERLRKDAERYRWLRSQHWSDSDIAVVVSPKKHTRLGAVLPSLELLDETIDHMREGTP